VALCCPPGRGCNALERDQPCVLDLCRATATGLRESALALDRWKELELARARGAGKRERRFRSRTYERAREDALRAVAMRSAINPDKPTCRAGERTTRVRGPTTRPGVPLSQHGRGRRG
jgi:hypothetical protein